MQPSERRFEDFFVEDKYVALKNHLYNYRLRRRAINAVIDQATPDFILEVGSGLSPIVTDTDRIVYSELSFRALQTLKRHNQSRGHYVVADGTRLPFKDDAVPCVVCSEVLEHVENDQQALSELARVLETKGLACITVPHRMFYFAADDRFVHHFRRYETSEMQDKLGTAGFQLRTMKKVLGPLEKVTMFSTVMAFSAIQKVLGGREAGGKPSPILVAVSPVFKWCNSVYALLARADAAIMPHALATVILFHAEKPGEPDLVATTQDTERS
jgi:ubiquinone/menaquinone biosynthesis C-methylase UbiE